LGEDPYLPSPDEIVFISKFNPHRGLSKKKTITRWVDDQLTEISDPVLAFDPGGADLIWAPPDILIAMSVPAFDFLLCDAPEMVAKLALRADGRGTSASPVHVSEHHGAYAS
jgi:hypothetical protein